MHQRLDDALNLCVLLFFAIRTQQQVLMRCVQPSNAVLSAFPAIIVQGGIASGVPSFASRIMLLIDSCSNFSLCKQNLFIFLLTLIGLDSLGTNIRILLKNVVYVLIWIAWSLQTLVPVHVDVRISRHPAFLIYLYNPR